MVGFGSRMLAPTGNPTAMGNGSGVIPLVGLGAPTRHGVGRRTTTALGIIFPGDGAGALGHTTNIGVRPSSTLAFMTAIIVGRRSARGKSSIPISSRVALLAVRGGLTFQSAAAAFTDQDSVHFAIRSPSGAERGTAALGEMDSAMEVDSANSVAAASAAKVSSRATQHSGQRR